MSDRQSDARHPGENEEIAEELRQDEGDMPWLKRASDSFRASTDFLDDGIRSEWVNAQMRFHSKHPTGSKYNTDAYKKRSKVFRPKTRSAARRAEALAAKALFSNSDLIDVRGQNTGDAVQAASARVNKEIIQYRLEHSIPWFVTAMGARQDAFNHGICISLQTWKYEEIEDVEYIPLFDDAGAPLMDEQGRELGEEIRTPRVLHDNPTIDLVPVENLRFDPNCDWRDPVGTSPVLTIMLPMYVGEVIERMTKPNPVTGEPEWRKYELATILTSKVEEDTNESVRQTRQGMNRQDPRDTPNYNEFANVWVHLHIMRWEGRDYAFYSLSNRLMLTKPVPVEEILPLGRDSVTVGFSIVEAHRPYPAGGNVLAAPLQAEINDVTNQRMDNVRLALNKRFILRRNGNIDQAALLRSVPGGGILADDVDKDVRVLDYNDVTGSSYQEQDRLAQEQDELMGTFSGSSVQANRSLNETVGGMNLLQGDAMSVAEYELRTWIETWVEPVLRKLQKLEAMFETDATVMQIAGENSEVFQKYGRDVAIDQLIDQELVISVNVGMGNTDPMQRVQRFSGVLTAAGGIPSVAERMKGDEVGKELFALGGYSEGERFFMSEDEFNQKQQAMQEQQQQPQPADDSLEIENIKSQDRRYEADRRFEAAMAKLASDEGIKLTELYEKIGLERDRLQTNRDQVALVEGNKRREMQVKREMGSGI